MKFFGRILIFTLTVIFMTSCREKEEKYGLNIISPSFQQVYDSISTGESGDKSVLAPASDYRQALNDETIKSIESVTVRDDNISTETAREIIRICEKENIPVFFLMNNIDSRTLDRYDKAFSISADYEYFGELFARKIHEMWLENITDKNGDQIFNFTVIKPENISAVQQIFYDSLLKNIELLGVPLERLDEVTLSAREAGAYCNENKDANEGFVILDNRMLEAACREYQPFGENVEITGISFGLENTLSRYSFAKVCFVNYNEYFSARNFIMENIRNNEYPFKDINYSISGKSVYIEPTI